MTTVPPAPPAPAEGGVYRLNSILDELDDAAVSESGPGGQPTAEAVYDGFMSFITESGRTPYPHQEEAVLGLVSDSHVILSTPTGSGKSLVAVGGMVHALAQGRTAYYTAPIKALVSERFFELIGLFGPVNVGMITGDSSVNPGAPIICCTAEILANLVLREGADSPTGDALVVMDEFHFYAEPDRGWAWQVPLLDMPRGQFLLMSATLGDVSYFARDLRQRTGRDVEVVADAERPVPLDFSWSVEPMHDLLPELVSTHRAPVYVVHFSQREAVERAQSLTSTPVASKEHRADIAAALGDFRFGPGFGQVLSKLLRQGIGVHHAGMLPRYRRLVERLAQRGILPVICGTDTLGVGINVPIRTVVITGLAKFDGERSRHLSVREFHQVAGRAGRAGFDTVGYVIVQAPEHEIDNAKALAKAGDDEKKRKKIVRKKPAAGQVNWTESTFERLRDGSPEALTSQFSVSHAMILQLLARDEDPVAAAWKLISDNHEPATDRNPHLRRAIAVYRSLKTAGVIEHRDAQWRREHPGEPYVSLTMDLPPDFALTAPLSPFALAAIDILDVDDENHTVDVVSIIEATLEDPRPILWAQRRAARGEAIAAMKAEGMDYDARMEALEEVMWPQPLAEELEASLEIYKVDHPWVADFELAPKSVVREMVETSMTFSDLISRHQVARSEGVVLRYLTDAYRALRQVVPEAHRTEELSEVISWLGTLVRAVDSSLLDEWEALADGTVDPGDEKAGEQAEGGRPEPRFGADADGNVMLSRNIPALRAAVAKTTFSYVRHLAGDDPEALARLSAGSGWELGNVVDNQSDLGETGVWPHSIEEWEGVLDDFFDDHQWAGIDQEAMSRSLVEFTTNPDDADLQRAGVDLEKVAEGRRMWTVRQIIDDDAGDRDWALTALVDVDASDAAGRVVLAVIHVGSQV